MLDEWQPVDAVTPLDPDQLQLWRIELGSLSEEVDLYLRHLSPDEVARASRLRAGPVQMQFVVARAALRQLLGFHLELPPGEVRLELTRYGKPQVESGIQVALKFNVTHSRSTIVIALCSKGDVGVDLEYLDRKIDPLAIAAGSFSALEHEQLAGIADLDLRRRAFFQCWTRKEAVIKADGRGLSLPLNCFTVPVTQPAEGTRIGVDFESEQRDFFVTDLSPGDGMAGAFAVDRRPKRSDLFQFPARFFRE